MRRLLGNSPIANGWRLLRLKWPAASTVGPGRFVRLAEPSLSLPVHYVSEEGWLALMAPPGLDAALTGLKPRAMLQAELDTAPGFEFEALADPPVLLGTDAGVPAVLFLAERLPVDPRLVLLGGSEPPPFRPVPSAFMLEGLPPQAIAAVPTLEAGGIPSRLANMQDLPGCFEGSAIELLEIWLASQPRRPLTIFACAAAGEIERLRALAARGGHGLRAVVAP